MLYKDMDRMLNFMLYLFPLFVTCAVKLRHVSFYQRRLLFYRQTDRHDWNYIPRRFAGGQ